MRPSFSNEYGGTFVLIEPGSNGDIVVLQPYFISARPLTQVEWSSIMNNNPSKFNDGWSAGLRPVENISWDDCQQFLDKLNETDSEPKLGLHGKFRLPTNDEWEYAGRADTNTKWYNSDRDSDLDDVAWHAGNSGASTREVGQKTPNNWGLYDVHGNVAEWTSSMQDQKYCTRGGSWLLESESTSFASKRYFARDKKSDSIGVRIVWEPD